MKRVIAILVLAIASVAAPAQAAGHPTIRYGSTGKDVTVAQFILKSHGWTVPIDGRFGARTLKVVRAFQRVSGLDADGIVGPATWSALESAVRVEPPIPPPAQQPLTGCDEAYALRAEAGLPAQFDAIIWRESNCRNDVVSSTGCCVGYAQIHAGNITAPGYRDGFAACGINDRYDMLGNSIEQKRANLCAAAVLHRVSGMSPWRTS